MNSNIENNAVIEKKKEFAFGSKNMDIAAVIISIITGLAFVLLIIKPYIGINTFLFSVTAITGVGYMLYKDENLDYKNFAFFGGAFLIYASVFFRLTQPVYNVLAFPILILLLVITTVYSTKSGAKQGLATFFFRIFGPVAKLDKIFLGLSSFKKEGKKIDKKYTQIIVGILISIGLLIIVIPLMMSAEAAFERFVEKIFDNINIDFEFQRFFWKTVAGTVIAIFFCGFLHTFTKDKMKGSKGVKRVNDGKDNHALIITVLSIMGFVFLVFAIVQFNSLFVSKEAVIENSTFAETARNGYFQLVVLSIINFIMVLMFTSMQKGTNNKTKNIIKILTTYFTVLNVYLLVSSAYKMTLYYNAYGLSVDRLLVYILLVYELAALVLLMVKIYKSNMEFGRIMLYYTVAFWAAVSLINIDASVARVNIDRYEETGDIDVEYLLGLSDDAGAEIKEFYFDNYDEIIDEDKEHIQYYFFDNRYYYFRYDSYESDEGYNRESYDKLNKAESWLEFNFSKNRKYNDGLEVLSHYLENE